MERDVLKKLTLSVMGLVEALSLGSARAERGDFHALYRGQSIDSLIIQFMEENNLPGLSVAIVQAPYIPRVMGYGMADTTAKRLVGTHTVFNIGQMTTAFTAVAIMQLKEENKLTLDDPIKKYIPNVPAAWNEITIRQLFTHSSGLPSYTDLKEFNYATPFSVDQIIQLFKERPLLFAPGTNVANSATDYYLLGLIVEKASGVSYEEYVTKNQIERVGLKHTFFLSTQNNIQSEINNGSKPFKHEQFKHDTAYINPTEPAVGYTAAEDKLVETKSNHWTAAYANAGIVSSAEDISLWDIALAGDILIKDAANRAFLYGPVTLASGKVIPANAGWQFPGHPGLMYITGNVPGFSSYLSRFTDAKELVCVTLLVNKDNVKGLDILARKIAGAYDANLAAPAGAPWTVTVQSPYTVEETLDRAAKIVEAQGGKVFARIDHSGEAAKVNQKLNTTQVLLIGNPSKGTVLMQNNNAIAIDLPLKVLAWRDNAGQVWVSFTDPVVLAKVYNITGLDPQLKKMQDALVQLVQKATTPY